MTDEFGVPVSERLPASQAEVVRRWDAAQAERQRARAEAEEAFKRTIFDPVWAAAEERIAVERDRLSVPFVSDWVRPSVSQRMLDARIGANTSARTLDEGQARQAIEHMVQVYTAAYREFEVVLASRRCRVCGSASACEHDAPAPGGAAEMLYPATPLRLRRPEG